MKWRNSRGKYLDEENLKRSLVGIPIKKFAWLPVQLKYPSGDSIWLQEYIIVHLRAIKGGDVYVVALESMDKLKEAQSEMCVGSWPFHHV